MAAPISNTPFKETAVRPQQKPRTATRDQEFWNSFSFPITKKEYGPITDVCFSPTEPYHYAVTSSTRVQVYHPENNQLVKTFSKFKEQVLFGQYRQDGKLIVAGTEAGVVKVYDVDRKSCLRILNGHNGAVHTGTFMPDAFRVLTCGDDAKAVLWDLASGEQITDFTEHKDCIRCCSVAASTRDLVLTGCYDHTARLSDTRTNSTVQSVDHGAPIEDVLVYPSGSLFITAGGNTLRIWDSLAGGKLLMELTNHHKTVTSLAFSQINQRLLSAGLDRHVKVYDCSSYQVLHTIDLPAPILSMAISKDDRCLAVGMADGMLSVQRRKVDAELTSQEKARKAFRQKVELHSFKPSKDAHAIQHKRKEHLAKYDSYLKRFEHSKALDAALEPSVRHRHADITVSVIQELMRRDSLHAALAGRDEKSLEIIMRFIAKNITDARFTSAMMDLIHTLVDIYGSRTDRISGLVGRLQALKGVVDSELKYEEQLLQLLGAMDSIFSIAGHTQAERSTVVT